MIPRDVTQTVLDLAQGYPVVAITGPRQSGKTTLARAAFPDHPFVSLEEPDARELADNDPRGFLARYPAGAVLDEVQQCPDLFSYLQVRVDSDQRPGAFVLTGSQHFGLLEKITQSLAGRVALVQLLPFTVGEARRTGWDPRTVDDVLFAGLYPPIHDRGLDPVTWFANYVETYVERDVRQIVNVRDLGAFRTFLRLCAGRCGQLVNLSSLASDAGITHNTARSWLSVLETSFIVGRLQPHHRNFGKRLVKTPKLYFVDPGLAAWLLGIREPDQLTVHPMRGSLVETWVISELLKAAWNHGRRPELAFWRDRTGHEVDIVVERGTALQAFEVKAGRTVTSDQLRGLVRWLDIAGDDAVDPTLVYAGDESYERSGVRVRSWRDIASL